FLLFFTNFAYSLCLNSPSSITVSSGNILQENLNPGSKVYVNNDLSKYTLKVDLHFLNSEENCFISENDVQFKLFSGGATLPANSITTKTDSGFYEDIASFSFSSDLEITSTLTSTYFISSSGNSQSSGNIIFDFDINPPSIDYFRILDQNGKNLISGNNLVKAGSNLSIQYQVSDSESGLKNVQLSGETSVNLAGNSSYSFSKVSTITSSKIYSLSASDLFNNFINKEISIIADGSAPELVLTNGEAFSKNYVYRNGNRYISITNLLIKDESFDALGGPKKVTGDFSSFNPSLSSVEASCSPSKSLENAYVCSWNNLLIQIDSTQNLPINFYFEDKLENSKIHPINSEIFVDKDGPQIIDFYLENSLGVRNIFSPNDKNISIYLSFSDESISKVSSQPKVIVDFNLIPFPETLLKDGNCLEEGNTITCIWELENSVEVFSGVPDGNLPFSITLIDSFANSNSDTLNLTLDKVLPTLLGFEYKINENIETGIVKSADSVDFSLYVSDKNLDDLGTYFVYGNLFEFSDISEGKNLSASCYLYNESSSICEFINIIARNGYRNASTSFKIYDSAGNYIIKKEFIEIYKKGNEVRDDFHVLDLNKFNTEKSEYLKILNPINRNTIKDVGVNAWFEGELVPINPADDFKLVNYNLKFCQFSGEGNPLNAKLVDFTLYPNENMRYLKKGDEKFAIKIQMADHENFADLNDMSMECIIAVLKKDSDTVYGTNFDDAEQVKVNLKFEFYDLPRGNLLKANAESILEMIDDVEWIGGWFDTTYSIYNIFKSVCTVVNSAGGIMATVSEAWTATSIALSATGVGKAIAKPVDNAVYKSQSILSDLGFGSGSESGGGLLGDTMSIVKTMCSWVTCENGGILSDMVGGVLDDTLSGDGDNPFTQLKDTYNQIEDAVCTVQFDGIGDVFGDAFDGASEGFLNMFSKDKKGNTQGTTDESAKLIETSKATIYDGN
ncbi:MAG: hypothetical protein KC550_01825, partial [Nanoarchaeota archaeon]|nr:hypothetical protein [Nanoarchaeota archaeon]